MVAALVGASACCRRPGKSDGGDAPGPRPRPGVVATATTFPPDARFLPIPAGERTVRVATKGAITLDVTAPAASLSEDHWEPYGEGGFRVFGINNHEGLGGWAIAGFTGAGEFPLTGEGGKVIVDVEVNARGESIGQHKVLENGKLRVEQFSTATGKGRLRATAYGTVKTDTGKVVNLQVAFNVLVPGPS